MAAIGEAPSEETTHSVGWLITAVGSRQKRCLRTVLHLSDVAWALEGVSASGAAVAEANGKES
jgi:hypothetical protein